MASRISQPARRSLDALFGSAPAGGTVGQPVQIEVARLVPNPFQPRTDFDPDKLTELAMSLERHGVLQALVVRRTPGNEDLYQIAVGERRYRAAQLAGLVTVPCDVREFTDDDMEELALVENIQREDLTPVEEAHALQRLMERRGLSMRALSDQLGKGHNYVEKKLKLIEDPRIAVAVAAGTVGATVAMHIAGVDDDEARTALLQRAEAGERIRVRDVQEMHRRAKAPAVPHNGAQADLMRPPTTNEVAAPPSETVPHNGAVTVPIMPLKAVETTVDTPETLPHNGAPDTTVHLRALRIIQLREGRDGEPRQLDTADRATVLRILEEDLAWLKDSDRRTWTSNK